MSSLKTQALLRRIASSSAPEQAFWKAVVSHAHEARPNWGLDLHPGRAPLAADAFVYLVDTSNLWVAAAAISPAQLVSVRTEVGKTGAVGNRPTPLRRWQEPARWPGQGGGDVLP